MDFDLNVFYRERDNIMNREDEDLNEYRKRITENKSQARFNTSLVTFSQGVSTQASLNTTSSAKQGSTLLERQRKPTRDLDSLHVSKELSLR